MAKKRMVTVTFQEPENCMKCPLAHETAVGSVYCAGRANNTLVLVEFPTGPRPQGCQLRVEGEYHGG